MSNDRTNEFLSLARNVSVSYTPQSTAQPPPPAPIQALQDFHGLAGSISSDIAKTSSLLNELANTIKHKSLFVDDTSNSNLNHLVIRIKQNIENLHARLETAESTLQAKKRSLNKQSAQEASNLVHSLQSEFAHTASDFKKVLDLRTTKLQETQTLQQDIYDVPDMPNLDDFDLSNNNTNQAHAIDLTSSLMSAGEATFQSASPYATTTSTTNNSLLQPPTSTASSFYRTDSTPLTPLDIARMEQEQQLQTLLPENDYLQNRANAMQNVESNLVELGGIFQKLAGLVQEHSELVQRVEDNVEEANTSILSSMGVLTDTLDNLRSNRQLMLRLFGVLISFIVIFIIFFA